MIKPALLIKLLKARLVEHEMRVERAVNATEANMLDMYANSSYRQAIGEEIQFLKTLLKESSHDYSP